MNDLALPASIQASYKIITPMFIGDAKQKASGISPQSFKGALRFWWRALAWGRIRQKHSSDEEALRALHAEEAILFGSSADDPEKKHDKKKKIKMYGKGKVAVKIVRQELEKTESKTVHPHLKKLPASRYLGYGVIEAFSSKVKKTDGGSLIRDCINENQVFVVDILVSDKGKVEEIKKALQFLGLLGGLGSKARKGYGSINLVDLKIEGSEVKWSAPTSYEGYEKQLTEILQDIENNDLPPFSALSKRTFIQKVVKGDSAYSAFENYAKAMIFYRSWGRFGKVLNKKSERNFKSDHDWSKNPDNFKKNFHPQRVVFGLPHNYGREKVERDLGRQGGRRSSPLFFHVHQIGSSFIGVAIIFKSQFLPENEKIRVGNKKADQKIEWEILGKKFLADARRFPGAKTIFPLQEER